MKSEFSGVTPGQSRLAVVLATTFCLLALVPAVLVTLVAGVMFMSVLSGTGATWNQALQAGVVLAAFIAGLVSFVMMRRSVTASKTWVWASLSIILVVAASAPVISAGAQGVSQQWCEHQPGGRGNAKISSLDEIPVVCR